MTADYFSGYQFNDPALLQRALTHRSVSNENNERLEFLGDAVLGQTIADYLYRTFPDANEGQLTRTRARLVNKETLAAIARSLDLGEKIRLGDGELKSGGWRRDSILANTLEALLGAIYLDGGYEACARQIKVWFDETLSGIDPRKTHKDPKTQLQELLQGQGRPLPRYTPVAVKGPDHDQQFTIECWVDGVPEPMVATGKSRRTAEQGAASMMLQHLGSTN